jgi:hypothetical protein
MSSRVIILVVFSLKLFYVNERNKKNIKNTLSLNIDNKLWALVVYHNTATHDTMYFDNMTNDIYAPTIWPNLSFVIHCIHCIIHCIIQCIICFLPSLFTVLCTVLFAVLFTVYSLYFSLFSI